MQNRIVKTAVLGLLTLLVASAAPASALEQQAAIDAMDARVAQFLENPQVADILAAAAEGEEILAEEQSVVYAACLASLGPSIAGVAVCTVAYGLALYKCSQIPNRFSRNLCYFSW